MTLHRLPLETKTMPVSPPKNKSTNNRNKQPPSLPPHQLHQYLRNNFTPARHLPHHQHLPNPSQAGQAFTSVPRPVKYLPPKTQPELISRFPWFLHRKIKSVVL